MVVRWQHRTLLTTATIDQDIPICLEVWDGRLANELMDVAQKSTISSKATTEAIVAQLLLVERDHPDSAMRHFLLKSVALKIQADPEAFISLRTESSKLISLLFSSKILATDLMFELVKKDTSQCDLSWEGGRRFHKHTKGETCACQTSTTSSADATPGNAGSEDGKEVAGSQ